MPSRSSTWLVSGTHAHGLPALIATAHVTDGREQAEFAHRGIEVNAGPDGYARRTAPAPGAVFGAPAKHS